MNFLVTYVQEILHEKVKIYMSHHTNWFTYRGTNRNTSAFQSTEQLFNDARESLNLETKLIPQEDIIKDHKASEALKDKASTVKITYKQQLQELRDLDKGGNENKGSSSPKG